MESRSNRSGLELIGDIAAKVLADCAAAMERKASGASKAGVNSGIGCPRTPLAAEATEGDLPEEEAVSPRSQAVGPEVRGRANDNAAHSVEGPPGSEGKCGRGFRNQADAGEVSPMRSPANRRGFEPEMFTGGFPYVRASVKE